MKAKRFTLASASLCSFAMLGTVMAGVADGASQTIHVAGTDGDGLIVRAQPSKSSGRVGWLSEGAVPQRECAVIAEYVGKVRYWFRINHGGVMGYIPSYYDDSHYKDMADLTAKYGIPECGAVPASKPTAQPASPRQSSVKPCLFNFRWSKKNLTFSYSGDHRYYGNAWQAAKNWSDLGLGITIVPAREGERGDIEFVDTRYLDNDSHAITDVPEYVGWKVRGTTSLQNPDHIVIRVGSAKMDVEGDYVRTLALTHEVGHALGLAHTSWPDELKDTKNPKLIEQAACTFSSESIMLAGDKLPGLSQRPNKPQEYDKLALKELYGL